MFYKYVYMDGCGVYWIRSEVYTGVIDITKAFGNVKYSILFEKLILASMSDYFSLCTINSVQMWNGIDLCQSDLLSKILFCMYINDLFKILRKKKPGCWINYDFFGIIGYADDYFFCHRRLMHSRTWLRLFVIYANTHNLSFSTDMNRNKCKIKCLAFLISDRVLRNIKLYGHDLPWMTSKKHLDSVIYNNTIYLLPPRSSAQSLLMT